MTRNEKGLIAASCLMALGWATGLLADMNRAETGVRLDLSQWECRQAITVQVLEGDKLTPKGQCIRYDMLIEEGEDQ